MLAAFDNLLKRSDSRTAELNAKPWIRIGTGLFGTAAGALDTLAAIKQYFENHQIDGTVSEVGTTGLCSAEPLLDVFVPGLPRILYGNVLPDEIANILDRHLKQRDPDVDRALASVGSPVLEIPEWKNHPAIAGQTRIALRNAGWIDPSEIEQYIGTGGYQGLHKALDELTPEQVLDEVKNSGLRGRGGAAFSTGTKWGFLAGNPAPQKYILCNCEEGDPGAFNDKAILESDPFTLIEGCTIAGYATGASNGIVFIRHGHEAPIARTRKAIQLAYANGLLGKDILGSGFDFDIEVSLVGESYVAGEETALMEAIEGKRSMPRYRPPFPAAYGVWGKPSNINNIKTLSYVPEIMRLGSAWFLTIGTEKSSGTAIACLSGDIRYPGLFEVPFGVTVREVVEGMGGGDPNGTPLKFLQTGGPLGGVLPAEQFDMVLDFDVMVQAGAMFGSGGLIVCNQNRSVVDLTRNLVAFDQMESCGKCFPCRLGTSHLLEILERICANAARESDLALMERVGVNMRLGSLCGHGQLGFNPVSSAIRFFEEEFRAQMAGRGPIPIPKFVGARVTRRGAQLTGETPTTAVNADFVLNINDRSYRQES